MKAPLPYGVISEITNLLMIMQRGFATLVHLGPLIMSSCEYCATKEKTDQWKYFTTHELDLAQCIYNL